MPRAEAVAIMAAARSDEHVSGHTHTFYRYPGRFPPRLAERVIGSLSLPGDLVLDPFAGGGTALVEAALQGRNAVGADLNPLAVLVSRAKTTALSSNDVAELGDWYSLVLTRLNLGQRFEERLDPILRPHLKNISDRSTWRIRNLIGLALRTLPSLRSARAQTFARCLLLRTGQWALDCKSEVPSASSFRKALSSNFEEMLTGAAEYRRAIASAHGDARRSRVICIHASAQELGRNSRLRDIGDTKLIITSPPYPGMHVVYHRWQVYGRKESSAPFWIAGSPDGQGESFYTLGCRKSADLSSYFEQAAQCFRSLAVLCCGSTYLVQLVGFAHPNRDLSRYIKMMSASGFEELTLPVETGWADGRLWRAIPNRKWYTGLSPDLSSRHEVVLFHRLAK